MKNVHWGYRSDARIRNGKNSNAKIAEDIQKGFAFGSLKIRRTIAMRRWKAMRTG
jgi:hypothetical protein